MAKHSQTSSERSKVRIFFVEGDFAPGDLQELTQALTTAIRPSQVVVSGSLPPRIASPAGNGAAAASGAGETPDGHFEHVVEEYSEDAEVTATPATKRPSKPRVYRKPEAVNIDFTGNGKPWKEFAVAKNPESHRAKYLVAATWLHEHAGVQTITADHVFTCYKTAGWNFDIMDPTVTFRQLKGERLGGLTRGSFTINYLGISEVNEMKAAA